VLTWQKTTLFSGHYLHSRSTLDIGVLGYICILYHKEHPPEVWHIPSGTTCILHGKVRTGNTAFHSYSIVARVSVVGTTWRLLRHGLATCAFTEPFHSNGCLAWLHNSYFQRTQYFVSHKRRLGTGSSVVGWGTMLKAGRSRVRVPIRSLNFFSLPNPSSRATALRFTQPLKEISIRKRKEFLGSIALQIALLT
jgi:hypothetical protein